MSRKKKMVQDENDKPDDQKGMQVKKKSTEDQESTGDSQDEPEDDIDPETRRPRMRW